MTKKILGLGIVLVILFTLVACNSALAGYRADAKAELTSYAESKGQENYTVENWVVIQGHITAGKAAIDAATDNAGVDSALAAAKQAVGAVMTIAQEVLLEHKMIARTELISYAESKGQENYPAKNWRMLHGYLTYGKEAINAAMDEIGVDSALSIAISASLRALNIS